MGDLPPFLKHHSTRNSKGPCISTIFEHPKLSGTADALWWPVTEDSDAPAVILFVPGNPGLIEFYTPFLTALHDKALITKKPLAILAHAHLGHTPNLPAKQTSLAVQVESTVEALDALQNYFGPSAKIILVGHSVGSWICTQVLKTRASEVAECLLLFPTITNIGSTPNGLNLSWLFRHPLPHLISYFSYMARLIPISVLRVLFASWPQAQLLVLRSLFYSAPAIVACLSMAHEEMETIRDLDVALINEHQQRICFYFAERDDWVGKERENILRAINTDPESIRVMHGEPDIPHAFCINHGEQIAQQCYNWLIKGHVWS